ncbi:MAG: hypothetical protein HRK26_04255 [Rickettsiaceae bacterium H1]|nr:hypothetical protein [Rickettsiaceae bacterium H1]
MPDTKTENVLQKLRESIKDFQERAKEGEQILSELVKAFNKARNENYIKNFVRT